MADYRTEERVLLFTDAHSFAKLMMELGNKSPDFIQAYYEKCGESTVSRGGQIIKYVGDSIFSTFAAGAEATAVECAIDMRKQYASLIEEFGVRVESDLEIGIGAGEVFVGMFGHPTLRNIDIFGDKVNVASRIMHHRGVAVTDEVKERLDDRFVVSPLPPVTMKWSGEKISIWEVAFR